MQVRFDLHYLACDSGIEPDDKDQRFVVQEELPYFGVRTRRFKAMLREGLLPELYDLRADPEKRHDLIAEHPLLHAGLMVLLSRAIEEDDGRRAGLRDADVSEEQRKMLEALGYLGN